MSKINIKPLGDRVVVEPTSDQAKGGKTKGGIILPETIDKERPEQGVVVAVGTGRLTDDGKVVPLRVKKGQKVLFAKYGPDEVKLDGKEYYILSESNILAIID